MQRYPRVALIIGSITLAIFTLAPSLLSSQDPRFRVERISTREGFSQSVVYSMMQDRYGFIWFGTRDGLEKYDGYKFRSYRYDPFDTTSLSDYIVSAIAEDSSGYIWVGTYDGGLNRLDRRTGRCVRYRHDPRNPNSLSSDHICSLAVDGNGVLWIGRVHFRMSPPAIMQPSLLAKFGPFVTLWNAPMLRLIHIGHRRCHPFVETTPPQRHLLAPKASLHESGAPER